VSMGDLVARRRARSATTATPTHPTRKGGNPFLGQPEQINADQYLSGGRVFGPVAVSRNLTPDHTGKPAGLSFEECRHLLRTGQDPDAPGKMLQVRSAGHLRIP
jgi:hypothetical protein